MGFLVMLVISLVLSYVAYLLAPKPKQPRREAADLQNPSVSAGRPIPVIFGTVTLKSPNILWYGEKGVRQYKVKA